MRIVYLSDYYYPFTGGAEEVCRMEAEELAKRGHDVSVVTALTSGCKKISEEIRGVKVFRLDLQSVQFKHEFSAGISWLLFGFMNYLLHTYSPSAVTAIRRMLKKIRPDIIHIHNFMEKIPLSIFHNLHELKVPVFITLHDYRLICPRATFFCHANLPCKVPKNACKMTSKLNKTLLNGRVKLFITPSKFLADCFKERFRDIEVVVIPNSIEKVETKTEKKFNTIQILYVGRLVWYKGIHVLLKAFRNLKYKDVKLLIAGKGPELETVRRFSHMDSRIIPLGFVSETEKRKLLRDASFTVIPSLWCEPFPMVALESFQSETPVVASKVGGLPEIIEDRYNGRLCEAGNAESLKDILAELIEDKNELRKLQKGAIDSTRRYFIDEHIKKLEKIYER